MVLKLNFRHNEVRLRVAYLLGLLLVRETLLQHFGQNLKAKRQMAGLSQEDLAAAAQLHRTYIGAVERGERNASLLSIVKLAKGLGVTVSELTAAL